MSQANETMTSRELNWTVDEAEEYLRGLSQNKMQDLIPTIAVFGLLTFVGIPGNTFIILVYSTCYKAGSTKVFVLAMAVFDLVSSALSFPLIIFEFHFLYTFPDFRFCKLMQAMQRFPFVASSCILVGVALDRRHRICKPLKRQLSPRQASYVVILSLILASLFTFPFLPLKGESLLTTDVDGVFGRRCGYLRKYRNSVYATIESSFLSLNIVVGIVVFLFCYSQIGYQLYKQKKKRKLGLPEVELHKSEGISKEASTKPVNQIANHVQKSSIACREHYEMDNLSSPEQVQLADLSISDQTGTLSSVYLSSTQESLNLSKPNETSGVEELVVQSEPPSKSSEPCSADRLLLNKETVTASTTIATNGAPGADQRETTREERSERNGNCCFKGPSVVRHRNNRNIRSRTTLMMFVLNLTVILTFIPYTIVT